VVVLWRLCLALSFSLAVTACSGSSGPVVAAGDRYVASQDGLEDYTLGSGDKLRVTVFNEPTLSGEFAVSTDGSMSVPLVGRIPVQGKKVEDVAALIQSKLGDGYLRDPKVSAEVTTYRPFFILGEVKSPGQYPYASGLTVLNAVATAQGFTPRANKDVVKIRRAGGASEETYSVTPELRIMPGDTIRVGERFF
jgi:polysaccharide biosynthesis/export protein